MSIYILTKEATMNAATIIDLCTKQGVTDGMVKCPKAQVMAALVTVDGRAFAGTNYVGNCDIVACPRLPDEKYEKCKTVCRQPWHGETSAIDNCLRNGGDPKGGRMYLTGHTICCPDCQAAMKEHGVAYAKCVDPNGKEYHF